MNDAQQAGVNAALIGQPGSRTRLATPALILDLGPFERNLQRMAKLSNDTGCALRPHAKAHKCRDVARAQVAAGAIGASCATTQEAEVMADANIVAGKDPGIDLHRLALDQR